MRAVVLNGQPGIANLTVIERADPTPGPFDVVVRVNAVSLNYRDLLLVTGDTKTSLPRVPCSDGAGQVVAVGSHVTKWKPGDRVMANFFPHWHAGEIRADFHRTALGGQVDGMLQELVALPEASWVATPAYLTDEEAATLPCAALTAWNALFESAHLLPGDTVLVQGTGGVSVFATQLAHLAGARVIATSSSDAKLARIQTLGAHAGINYKTTPDWDAAARDLTNKIGVDQVIEVGGSGTLPKSLAAVRTGGRIAMIGVLSGRLGEIPTGYILARSMTITGIYVGSVEMFERMTRALTLHQLHPIIDHVYSMTDAPAAFTSMQNAQHFGKIVVSLK